MGLELIRQYEMSQDDPQVLKKVDPRKVTGVPSSAEARGWLRDRFRQKGGQGIEEVDQLRFLMGVFPEVPVDVLGRACVSRPTHDEDTSQVPWNRRLRRSVSRAKPESVLLNCSDKQPGWKGLGRVIQVPDSARGLGSRAVFRRLLEWAESGVIGGVIRSENPTGGLDLEGLGSSLMWGAKGVKDQESVQEREVLWLRSVLLFAVAQAAKDSSKIGLGPVPKVEALPDGSENSESEPEAGADSQELMSWALSKALKRLSGPSCKVKSPRNDSFPEPIFLVFECLKDPNGLGARTNGQTGGVEVFQEMYGLHEVGCDQGCFGAPQVAATKLLTSSWWLFEAVHEVRVPKAARARSSGARVGSRLASCCTGSLETVEQGTPTSGGNQGKASPLTKVD